MKPTVSPSTTSPTPGTLRRRMVGSSVANSLFSAMTSAVVSALNSVDLPALV